MLELGAGADILRALGWLYLGLMALLIAAALWFPERWWQKVIGALVVLMVFTGPAYLRSRERAQLVDEHKVRYEKARAVFDERCKTAGEKIYKTVDGVDGVLLLNVRPSASDGDRHDRNWLEAGLPGEFGAEGYIANFLTWEHPYKVLILHGEHKGETVEDKRNPRGYLSKTPSDLPGYRYVDAKDKDGVLRRYAFKKPGEKAPLFLAQDELRTSPARYAVSYTNVGQPSDREHWVAGTTVTVTDTQTSEILAQGTWYSFVPSLGTMGRQSTPWAFSVSCPDLKGMDNAPTRFFVDHVLKPKKGD